VLADALRLEGAGVVAAPVPGLHPTRSAQAVAGGAVGSVGEVDPEVLAAWGIARRRVGWLEVDLGMLATAARRPALATPVSRFPSSDVDVALVVSYEIPAAQVEAVLRAAGGPLLESIALFDVWPMDDARRSLAYRLRFCADDRTLTDEEVGALREGCIDAARSSFGAVLR
jgi:phenylalanyl-tRNA synthetase beta chain